MSLLKIVVEKLPPSQRSSLENDDDNLLYIYATFTKQIELKIAFEVQPKSIGSC